MGKRDLCEAPLPHPANPESAEAAQACGASPVAERLDELQLIGGLKVRLRGIKQGFANAAARRRSATAF
jgi:hypothetical protein